MRELIDAHLCSRVSPAELPFPVSSSHLSTVWNRYDLATLFDTDDDFVEPPLPPIGDVGRSAGAAGGINEAAPAVVYARLLTPDARLLTPDEATPSGSEPFVADAQYSRAGLQPPPLPPRRFAEPPYTDSGLGYTPSRGSRSRITRLSQHRRLSAARHDRYVDTAGSAEAPGTPSYSVVMPATYDLIEPRRRSSRRSRLIMHGGDRVVYDELPGEGLYDAATVDTGDDGQPDRLPHIPIPLEEDVSSHTRASTAHHRARTRTSSLMLHSHSPGPPCMYRLDPITPLTCLDWTRSTRWRAITSHRRPAQILVCTGSWETRPLSARTSTLVCAASVGYRRAIIKGWTLFWVKRVT